jgi:hypothetical protein
LFRAALVLLVVGVALMLAGAIHRDPATVLAATAHFAVGAALALVDLLGARRR